MIESCYIVLRVDTLVKRQKEKCDLGDWITMEGIISTDLI